MCPYIGGKRVTCVRWSLIHNVSREIGRSPRESPTPQRYYSFISSIISSINMLRTYIYIYIYNMCICICICILYIYIYIHICVTCVRWSLLLHCTITLDHTTVHSTPTVASVPNRTLLRCATVPLPTVL